MGQALNHGEMTNGGRYAIGGWDHLFGPGKRLTTCRIVVDVGTAQLVAAQEWTGLKFEDMCRDRFNDLAESVIEVNEAHLDLPGWMAECSETLPDWVDLSALELEQQAERVFSIVASNLTGDKFAWEGKKSHQLKYLGNREVIAEVMAPTSEVALQRWTDSIKEKSRVEQ